MASEAAGEQNKFWQYHDLLMGMRASSHVDGDITVEKLEGLARQLGLNMAQFDASLTSDKFREKVMKDDAEGQAANVTGTPTFFVNGNRGVGAPPFDIFQRLIGDLLQGKIPDGT
jgi:protein-disulfide isomerase